VELAKAVTELLKDPNQRHNVGEAAKRFVEQNRGARDKVVAMVDALI
jgi:3-deoxy-D-manno-octulosonic-acid transferase